MDSSAKVHEDAWRKAVSEAEDDSYTRYGLYASRVLSLAHPEVHLRGDSRFTTHITTNRGYSNSYAVRDTQTPDSANHISAPMSSSGISQISGAVSTAV
jgi:hypothetical protein